MDYIDHFNELEKYKDFQPTSFDCKGLHADSLDIGSFKVFPISQTRDSEAATRANFDASIELLGGESETVQIHRFGHWGPGWFEIILISPLANDKTKETAGQIICGLENYPLVDEELTSEYEQTEADEVWANCYNDRERLEYIKKHYSQFEPNSLTELRECIRGEIFIGYASELLY